MTEGSARLGVLELLVCRFSVIEVLRFAIPNEHLQELVYLGQTYAAEKALSLGLLDEIMKAESLLERAKEVGQARVSSDVGSRALQTSTLPTLYRASFTI